jgi:hypothetical protein
MCRDSTLGFRQAQFSPASRRHPWAPTSLIVTNLKGLRKALYEKCSANLSKTWSADAVPAWSRWQANQLPAHRHLLAAAQLRAAMPTVLTIRRTSVKIAVGIAELKGVLNLPIGALCTRR